MLHMCFIIHLTGGRCKNISVQTDSDRIIFPAVIGSYHTKGKGAVNMILSIGSYVQQGRHRLRKWALDPRIHGWARATGHFLSGLLFSAASLAGFPMPLSVGLVLGTTGWQALLTALGSGCGYLLFWGSAGRQGVLWTGAALAATLIPGQRMDRQLRLLLPAMGALILSGSGVLFQLWLGESPPVPLFLLRVALGAGSTALFLRVSRERNPVLDWLAGGVAVLALAQVAPIPYLGLGYLAAGVFAAAGAFPGAALAGLALDLAQVTPIPMTAVLCGSFLVRFVGDCPKWLRCAAPCTAALLVMGIWGKWDLYVLPGLLLGGTVGVFLPIPGKVAHRRGETGAAQVRLELAAAVFSQAEQLLLEAPRIPVDEDALVARAAERACGSCPCRKNCSDSRRLQQLPGLLLHKPLLTPEELPLICRKSGRFLAELHRSQEQLRAIRADRERQKEYRTAITQQYRFLSEYLQSLSDSLARRGEVIAARFSPEIRCFGNRQISDNGDRFVNFTGTRCRHYALLCDGMGKGLGAAGEARTACTMLRRLLSAGFPPEYALRSLNSLCALRDRAGAVTVDLAEVELDSGRVTLYKWGAAPSWLVTAAGTERLGSGGPPPGISVAEHREAVVRLSLRREELLLMVSDGISQEALREWGDKGADPEPLATALLSQSALSGEDDATLVTLRLRQTAP